MNHLKVGEHGSFLFLIVLTRVFILGQLVERFLHQQYVVDIRFRRGEHITHQSNRTKLHCTSSGCKAVITCKCYKICNIQYTYMFVVFTTYM